MKRLVLLLALSMLAACKKPADAPAQGAVGQSAPQAAAAGWTEAKVKAYLELQRGVVAMLSGHLDGGARPSAANDEAMAAKEAALRKQSGLTDEEVATLEKLVAAFAARQMLMKMAEIQVQQVELRRAREELPDASVPEIDHALSVMEARKKRQESFSEERARFGDALVNVAAPHEKALVENWSAMLAAAQEYGEAREGEH